MIPIKHPAKVPTIGTVTNHPVIDKNWLGQLGKKKKLKKNERGRTHHDPCNSLPVDCLGVTVAKSNTDGGTSDAHGGGDGETVLGSENDGNGGSKFHRESTRGRVKSDVVTESTHDVVTVSGESDDDAGSSHDEDPDGNGRLLFGEGAGGPAVVDDGVGTDGVGDIVGSVGEGSAASGQDLDERVHWESDRERAGVSQTTSQSIDLTPKGKQGLTVLNLVGVLLGTSEDFGHLLRVGGTLTTGLSSVNIERSTVSEDLDNEGDGLVTSNDVEVLGFCPGANDGVLVDLLELGAEGRRSELVVAGVASGSGFLVLLGARLDIVLGDGNWRSGASEWKSAQPFGSRAATAKGGKCFKTHHGRQCRSPCGCGNRERGRQHRWIQHRQGSCGTRVRGRGRSGRSGWCSPCG